MNGSTVTSKPASFWALAGALSLLSASPALSQSFDFKSIQSLNAAAVAKSNVIIDRIGPAGVAKRLNAENILSEVDLSKKISAAKDKPVSAVLRDLITATAKTGFQTSLNNLGIKFDLDEATKNDLFGTTPAVEASPTFEKNVSALINEKSGEPGFLRIWRGTKVVKPDVYSDVVLIAGNNALCTGTLIDPLHVISAAHCFCGGVSHEVSVGTGLLDVAARAEVDLDKSRTHIDCDKLTDQTVAANVGKGDIALLTLKTPLSGVTVRRIASEDFVRAAASVRAVGFGRTEQDPGGIKFVVDIVVASYDCTGQTESQGGKYGCTPKTEMIAAGLNRDTCNGDSGGPIYVLGQDINLYLAAVTSRSVDPNGTCGKGGIYAKLTVPEIKQWLIDGGVPSSSFLQ